jgi:hypothetical protein
MADQDAMDAQTTRWFNPNAVLVGVPNLEGVSGAIFRRASPTLP